MMKKLFGVLAVAFLLTLPSTASLAQQMEKPAAKEGQGMMGGGMGMMTPMMGMPMMGMPMMGMPMMGGTGGGDPKMMGRMMEMQGEMMMKMGEVMVKHGKMMQKGATK